MSSHLCVKSDTVWILWFQMFFEQRSSSHVIFFRNRISNVLVVEVIKSKLHYNPLSLFNIHVSPIVIKSYIRVLKCV